MSNALAYGLRWLRETAAPSPLRPYARALRLPGAIRLGLRPSMADSVRYLALLQGNTGSNLGQENRLEIAIFGRPSFGRIPFKVHNSFLVRQT